ncbi:WD40-repeat-containing domain protein, partial [Gorgonomyces haynaldii]
MQPKESFKSPNFVKSIKYLHNTVLYATEDDQVCHWNGSKLELHELIYDYTLSTNFIYISTRDHPLKVYNHQLEYQHSLVSRDHMDQITAPLTVREHMDLVYCGFENQLQIFDLEGQVQILKLTSTRKSPDGIKGLVSSIEFSDRDLYCIGTFHGQIGIYDRDTNRLLYQLHSQKKPGFQGITQTKFTHCENYLLASSRNDSQIDMWDLRMLQIVHSYPRNAQTNQRLYFDYVNGMLVFGDLDGCLSIYNTLDQSLLWQEQLSVHPLTATTFCPSGVLVSSGTRFVDGPFEHALYTLPWSQ